MNNYLDKIKIKTLKNKHILILCYLFFISFTAISQKKDTINVLKLTELSFDELLNMEVFTASKKSQKISEAPAIISVITRQDIEKMGVTSLIDVFKYVPGIETSMGPDGKYRLSIRGTRKEGNILMLIDGRQMNDFYNGKAIFDLPLDFIDRIEIVRGPGSALYGSNAIAGVINIFTIKTKSISASGGTNNTFSGNINYNITKEKIEMNVSGGYVQSDGANAKIDRDDAYLNKWSLTYNGLNYKTQRWIKDAYINTNFKAGNFKFNLFGISRKQGSYAGPLYIATPGSNLKTNQLTGALSYDFNIKDIVTITPKIYTNIVNRDFLDQETPDNYQSVTSGNIFTGGKKTHEKYTGITYGGELCINIKVNEYFNISTGNVIETMTLPKYDLERNYKIVGDEYKSTFGNYDSISLTQKNKQRNISATFLQGDYKWKKINITAGIRYDNYSDFGQSINPRLGITYNASKLIRFKGLYGRAFRAPTFQELYDNTTLGNQYGVKGNQNLKPETIQTIELGTEFTYKKIILRYNVFYNMNRNAINIYDSRGSGSIGFYENIGNITTFGHEAEAIVIINKNINFFSNFSQYVSEFEWNTETIRKADVTYFNKQSQCNKQLKNIPNIRSNAGFSIGFYKFTVFAGLNYGSASGNNKRFYLEENHFVKIPAYLQGNFKIIYNMSAHFKIKLAANNLGKKYSDPDESTNIATFGAKGLAQPSETVLLELTYKF
jgi:outer membrane cobalamin receptor